MLLTKDRLVDINSENMQDTDLFVDVLKGQSNEIFDPVFFSPFEPAWSTDQWVKIFSNFRSFSPK